MKKKKKLRLKKQAYIFLAIIIFLIVGIILGNNYYNDYKYKQTNEYKLTVKGYTLDESKEIINHLNDDETNDINVTSRDIRQKDYVTIIHRDLVNNKDSFLIRDIDYTLVDVSLNESYSQTRLTFTNNIISSLNSGDMIIISGIKLGKDGR